MKAPARADGGATTSTQTHPFLTIRPQQYARGFAEPKIVFSNHGAREVGGCLETDCRRHPPGWNSVGGHPAISFTHDLGYPFRSYLRGVLT
jgi:hypothetical protein